MIFAYTSDALSPIRLKCESFKLPNLFLLADNFSTNLPIKNNDIKLDSAFT